MFPESPSIERSHNYDLFKKIEWNRPIDKGNFTKLLKENREKFQLHKFPILITNDFKIIDGQHRFEVSKELGSPIYFIKDTGHDDSFAAVHSVNKAGKKHTMKDKIEMLYRAGDSGAAMIYKVATLYQGKFDVAVIANALMNGSTGGDNNARIDENGAIILGKYEFGIEVLDALFYSSLPNREKGRSVMALYSLYKKNKVHPKAIVKRIQANMSKWIEPKSKQEAERSMANCYNYGLQINNRIKTSFEK